MRSKDGCRISDSHRVVRSRLGLGGDVLWGRVYLRDLMSKIANPLRLFRHNGVSEEVFPVQSWGAYDGRCLSNMIARDTLVHRTLLSLARQRPGLDEPRCHAVLDLMATADAVRSAVRHNTAFLGVSELQFYVMVLLLAMDPLPCTPALLADNACVTRSAITEALDRVESRKWITRERSQDDRRTYLIALTALGRTVIDQLAPAVLHHMGDIAGGLVGEMPEQLRALCATISGTAQPGPAIVRP